jgi:hypothetical protein
MAARIRCHGAERLGQDVRGDQVEGSALFHQRTFIAVAAVRLDPFGDAVFPGVLARDPDRVGVVIHGKNRN